MTMTKLKFYSSSLGFFGGPTTSSKLVMVKVLWGLYTCTPLLLGSKRWWRIFLCSSALLSLIQSTLSYKPDALFTIWSSKYYGWGTTFNTRIIIGGTSLLGKRVSWEYCIAGRTSFFPFYFFSALRSS